MFLTDHPGSGVQRSEMAPSGSSEPDAELEVDDELIATCKTHNDMHDALHAGIEQEASTALAIQESRMSALCELDRDRVADVGRIAAMPAHSKAGALAKLTTLERLLTWRLDEPTPMRDALLLSFIEDIDRLYDTDLCFPNEASPVIAASQAALTDIDELVSGYDSLDDESLTVEQLSELAARLTVLQDLTFAAIADLVAMKASSLLEAQAKAAVLRSMLRTGHSDAHLLRVDLARSYVANVASVLRPSHRRYGTVASYTWCLLTSRIRRLRPHLAFW